MEKTEGGLRVDGLILPNRNMLLIKGEDYNPKSVQAYNLKEENRRSGLKADASERLNHTNKEEDLSKCSSSSSSWRSLLMQFLNVMALFKNREFKKISLKSIRNVWVLELKLKTVF